MARKRKHDGFVPIGDVADGLSLPGGRALTHRAATPQARHHFTKLNRVTQLVGARDADPEIGFMARLLALCSLPRTNPGDRLQYVRRTGPYTLILFSSGKTKLPYGTLPRLLLAWVCTEAVRPPVLVLGDSLSEFMRRLDIYSTSGGTTGGRTRLRNQMRRLFGCMVGGGGGSPEGDRRRRRARPWRTPRSRPSTSPAVSNRDSSVSSVWV